MQRSWTGVVIAIYYPLKKKKNPSRRETNRENFEEYNGAKQFIKNTKNESVMAIIKTLTI